jgi:prolyl-tRNA synthetase
VIVPIIFSSTKASEVLKKCDEVSKELESSGFRVFLDSRENYTPGWKFNEWELKGVPLRLELGPRDVSNNTCVIVRRDTGEKETVPLSETVKITRERLDQIQSRLYDEAKRRMSEQLNDVTTLDQLKNLVDSKGGFVRAPWCGGQHCEVKVKDETGADIRLLPFDERPATGAQCIVCGKAAKELAYFARAY